MITENGYVRPSYDDLLAGRIALAKELFGEDVDTENNSPLGKFIRLSVQDLADAYEAQEIIYYSRFPGTATGQSLDHLMPFAGITRNAATRAEHEIKFTGTAGATIDPGFLVGTTGDEEFYLVNALTLGEDGTGTGIVQCTELGTVGNVSLGSITEIINPNVNVTAIEHTAFVTLGVVTETDPELRERFRIAIQGAGTGATAAIRGAVMRISGVRSCIVVENDTDTTDANGIPPHAFEVFVYASELLDQQIAEAIFSKKPVGIGTYGTVSKTVYDESGNEQTVKFSKVTPLPIYINISIVTNTSFELDGVEQIKAALMDYINNLSNGENVIFARLYDYIFNIVGVEDVPGLSISSDGSTFATSNIIISHSNIATLAADDIEVISSANL